ncbi:hypothetical protein L195_g063866, partial [Trifolium pratense]
SARHGGGHGLGTITVRKTFLATGRALIDVELGELMLRTDGEQVLFNVFEAMKQ